METIDEALAKRFGRSLVHLMKLIDPERRYSIDEHLGKAWDALSLTDQRRLYLYLLYRKWRAENKKKQDFQNQAKACTSLMNGYVKSFVNENPEREPDEIQLTVKILD